MTTTIRNEDHTMGNLLRNELLSRDDVEFAAYKATHPLKKEIQLHVVSENDRVIQDSIVSLKKKVQKLRSKSF